MVIGGTLTCRACNNDYILKYQVGDLDTSNIRICCSNCGIVLRGQFFKTKKSHFEFENAKYTEGVDYNNTQAMAISTELPILHKRSNVKKSAGLTPFILLVQKFKGVKNIRRSQVNNQNFERKWNKEGSNLIDLTDLLLNSKYDFAQIFIKEKFLDDISITKGQSFQSISPLISSILHDFTKDIHPPSYKSYYYDKLLINKVLKKTESNKKILSNLIDELKPYLNIEVEFNNALKLTHSFIRNLNSFLPVIYLGYETGYKSRFMDEYLIATFEYEELKDKYVELFEHLSRVSILYIAITNFNEHKNINTFSTTNQCSDIEDYFRLNNGLKKDVILKYKNLNNYFRFLLDSQLRNGISHFKTKYRAQNQLIKYFPFSDPQRKNKYKEIYLTDFAYQIYLMVLASIDFIHFVGRINKKILN